MAIQTHSPSAQTYLLVGDDFPFLQGELETARRNGVIIVQAKDYASITDAAAAIKTPANVILAAHGWKNGMFQWKNHGKDGKFSWDNGDMLAYRDLFAALPRSGIHSITLEGCYGGTAENFLQAAPRGTVVQSMIGPSTPSFGTMASRFTQKLAGTSNQIDLLLSALHEFDSKEFQSGIDDSNHENAQENRKHNQEPGYVPLDEHQDSNPAHALPHIVGIGGGEKIDLFEELYNWGDRLRDHKINQDAWRSAIAKARSKLDVDQNDGADAAVAKAKSELGLPNGAAANSASFDAVVVKMQRGEKVGMGSDPVRSAEESRLGYALTAAYLDISGEFEQHQQAAMQPHDPKNASVPLSNSTTQAPAAQNLQEKNMDRPKSRIHFPDHDTNQPSASGHQIGTKKNEQSLKAGPNL